MSADSAASFEKLGTAIEQLRQAAAELSERSRVLAQRLAEQYAEVERREWEVTASVQAAGAQRAEACAQLERDRRDNGDALQRCRRTIEEASRSTISEMEGPLGDMDMLGEALLQGLDATKERLAELNGVQTRADQARLGSLTRYQARLQQADGQLAATASALREAATAMAAATQAEQGLAAAQSAQQALALSHQAALAYHQGHRQTALALIEQAVTYAPRDVTIRLDLARLCLEAGRLEQATQAWRAAADLAPQSVEVLHTEAMLALKSGQAARAIQLLGECVARAGNPTDLVDYRLSLAEAHYADGHPQRALDEWRQVLAIEPMQPVARGWVQALE